MDIRIYSRILKMFCYLKIPFLILCFSVILVLLRDKSTFNLLKLIININPTSKTENNLKNAT